MTLSPQRIASIAVEAARDKKAKDIVTLDIFAISTICDYFVICSGMSSTQVKAIAENIEQKLEEQNISKLRVEGLKDANWILLDYGAVVVHVFQEDDRAFYNLEHLWGDAAVVQL